jgi:hypothetical protein
MDGVVLPGVGGMINASNSQSDPSLEKENKEKRKWGAGVNKDGFMTIGKVDHNEQRLASHKERRDSKVNLINRDMNEYADSAQAMSEIVGRKNLRAAQYRELKKQEYCGMNYAEAEDQNAEYLAMGTYGEGCSAGKCPPGCSCASCRAKKKSDADYREWSSKKREELSKGEVKGKFAGPDQSFPISNATDVKAAWSSVGRAKNPRAVMKNIIRIAKEMGLESALPASVKKRLEEGGSGLPG